MGHDDRYQTPFLQNYIEEGGDQYDRPPTPSSPYRTHPDHPDHGTRHQDGNRVADSGGGLGPMTTQDNSRRKRRFWYQIKDSSGSSCAGRVENERRYVESDLTQEKINRIHKHLWWVGRPGNIRPLHHQKAMFRDVIVTERSYLHLVWFENNIFLKPLPEYLLDRKYFEEIICPDPDLYKLACGFLYSYSKLIVHRSDHKIAEEHDLIPEWMDWVTWCEFSKEIKKSVTIPTVNKRYRYGELRLRRLNHVYRFCKLKPRGFYSLDRGYNSFFRRNFGWLVGLFAFLTIILTGMQVVLATPQGQEGQNTGLFRHVSYVFGVVSIVIPVVVTGTALGLFFVLFWWNVRVTLLHRRKKREERLSGCIA